MDTHTITDPISRVSHQVGDRLPSGAVSTVSDVTGDLAGQITDQFDHLTDQLGDIDFSGAARRTRLAVAGVVPWMSVGPTRRFSTRRWLAVAGLAAVVIGVAVLLRRRSTGPTEPPARDDWSTGSANGTTPPADSRQPDRATATTTA